MTQEAPFDLLQSSELRIKKDLVSDFAQEVPCENFGLRPNGRYSQGCRLHGMRELAASEEVMARRSDLHV